MREFWDARADEDAFFFVDNRLEYGNPDLDEFWAGGAEAVDLVLAAVEVTLSPEDDVVEIGCGVGRLTRVLAARARGVRALDVSHRMIELARSHNESLENVEWLNGDGASLEGIEDSSADAIFSHVVFQHIPDPAVTLAYVAEMGRVLRPGGWSAFQISNLPDLHRSRGGVQRAKALAMAAFGRGPKGQSAPEWLGSSVEIADLTATAAGAGLEVEKALYPGTQHCLILLRKPAN